MENPVAGMPALKTGLSSISFLWVDLQWGLMTQVVQVQEGMFHVEHQQRKSVSEKHKAEKEKNYSRNLKQIREKKKGNSEVLQSGIKFVVIIPNNI